MSLHMLKCRRPHSCVLIFLSWKRFAKLVEPGPDHTLSASFSTSDTEISSEGHMETAPKGPAIWGLRGKTAPVPTDRQCFGKHFSW